MSNIPTIKSKNDTIFVVHKAQGQHFAFVFPANRFGSAFCHLCRHFVDPRVRLGFRDFIHIARAIRSSVLNDSQKISQNESPQKLHWASRLTPLLVLILGFAMAGVVYGLPFVSPTDGGQLFLPGDLHDDPRAAASPTPSPENPKLADLSWQSGVRSTSNLTDSRRNSRRPAQSNNRSGLGASLQAPFSRAATRQGHHPELQPVRQSVAQILVSADRAGRDSQSRPCTNNGFYPQNVAIAFDTRGSRRCRIFQPQRQQVRRRHRSDVGLLRVSLLASSQAQTASRGWSWAEVSFSVLASGRNPESSRASVPGGREQQIPFSRDSIQRPAQRRVSGQRSGLVAGCFPGRPGAGSSRSVAHRHGALCDLRVSHRGADQLQRWRYDFASMESSDVRTPDADGGWSLRESAWLVVVPSSKAKAGQERSVGVAAQRLYGLASQINSAQDGHRGSASFRLASEFRHALQGLAFDHWGIQDQAARGSTGQDGTVDDQAPAKNLRYVANAVLIANGCRNDQRPRQPGCAQQALPKRRSADYRRGQQAAGPSRVGCRHEAQDFDTAQTVLTENYLREALKRFEQPLVRLPKVVRHVEPNSGCSQTTESAVARGAWALKIRCCSAEATEVFQGNLYRPVRELGSTPKGILRFDCYTKLKSNSSQRLDRCFTSSHSREDHANGYSFEWIPNEALPTSA